MRHLIPRIAFLFALVVEITTFERFWLPIALGLYTLPLVLSHLLPRRYFLYSNSLAVLLIAQSCVPVLISPHSVRLPANYRARHQPDPAVEEGERFFTTDSHGYRTTLPIDYDEKSQGTFRVFAIGGSTTIQTYLDDRSTWTHLVQEEWRRRGAAVEVINTGVSGVRAGQHLETLRSIEKYQPDMAIFLLGFNDWNHHIRLRSGSVFEGLRHRFQRAVHRLTLRTSPLGRAMESVAGRFAGPQGRNYVTRNTRDPASAEVSVRDFKASSVLPDYAETLRAIGRECRRMKIACVFLTQPHGYQFDSSESFRKNFWMDPGGTNYRLDLASLHSIAQLYNQFLQTFATEHGFRVCDIASRIPATSEYFYDDCHYTGTGARRVATEVLACLGDVRANLAHNGVNPTEIW